MNKKIVQAIIGPFLFFLLAVLPPLPFVTQASQQVKAPFPNAPQVALGGLIWVATWWIFEVAPLGLTGLLAAVLFSFLGFVSWGDSLKSFTDPIIWVFMGGFVLAKAFQVSGLDRRIALWIANLYKGQNPMIAALFVAGLPVFFLTMTGSITASTSVVYPIVLSFLALTRASDRYSEATLLLLGEAATAGAMLFLISTPPNLIAKQVIESNVPGLTLTFFDWFIVGTVQAVIGLLIVWIIVFAVLGVKKEHSLEKLQEIVIQERAKLPPMSIREKIVLGVFLFALFLWLIPGLLNIAANLDPNLQTLAKTASSLLPEAVPAVLAILLLGLIKVQGRPLLTFKEISEGIDWNVVFLFGGGLAMGKALDSSGFSSWIGLIVTNSSIQLNTYTLSIIGGVLGFLITFPASNTASAIVATPLIAKIAKAAGVNPVAPVITTALACSISSAIPSTTPPMAIIYGSGKVNIKNMFKAGFLADVTRLLFLIATEPILVQFFLSLKGL